MFAFDRRQCVFYGTAAVEAQELTAEQKRRDVFEAHRHRVFSISYYMTANEVEAEEILTGAFVRAFSQTPAPDAAGVDRALLDELGRRFSLAPEPPAYADGSGGLGRTQVRRTDMEEAVATLPPRERLVFLLKDVEGYAPARIAGLLGCEEPDVLKTLFSARIRMRNAVKRLQARAMTLAAAGGNAEPALAHG